MRTNRLCCCCNWCRRCRSFLIPNYFAIRTIAVDGVCCIVVVHLVFAMNVGMAAVVTVDVDWTMAMVVVVDADDTVIVRDYSDYLHNSARDPNYRNQTRH